MSRFDASLQTHPLFRDQPPNVAQEVVESGRTVFLEPIGELYRSGVMADRVYLVTRGALQIEYPETGEQRGVVVAILTAPAVLGECQVIHRQVWTGTGVALTKLSAVGVTRSGWMRLLESHPTLAKRLYLELSQRFLAAINTWRETPQLKPQEALARYLQGVLRALRRVHQNDELRTIIMRQQDIATAAQLRRETVNRVLKQWQREKALNLRPGRVDVLNEAILWSCLKDRAHQPLLQAPAFVDPQPKPSEPT